MFVDINKRLKILETFDMTIRNPFMFTSKINKLCMYDH